MNKQNSYKRIQYVCTVRLILGLLSFLQPIQAQALPSHCATENNQQRIQKPEFFDNDTDNSGKKVEAGCKPPRKKKQPQKTTEIPWPDNGAPNSRQRAGAGRSHTIGAVSKVLPEKNLSNAGQILVSKSAQINRIM